MPRALERLAGIVQLAHHQLRTTVVRATSATGGPPILIGGQLHRRNVQRITQWADGWMPHPMAADDDVAAGVAQLRAAMDQAGRDRHSLRVSIFRFVVDADGRPDLDATMAAMPHYADLGATAVAIPFGMFVSERNEWDAWFDRAAAHLQTMAR